MGLVRQLVSHGFLVAAIILALLAFIFGGDLFTDDVDHQVVVKESSTESEEHVTTNAGTTSPNGTAVVLTAEQVAEEVNAAEQSVDEEKISENQSDYRPAVDPVPVHIDIEEEIKKVAPPPVGIEAEQQPVYAPEVADDAKAELMIDATAQAAIDATVEGAAPSVTEVESPQAEQVPSQQIVEIDGTQPEEQPHFVDEASYGAVTKPVADKISEETNINPAPNTQSMNAYQDAYGPVYGQPSSRQPQRKVIPEETEAQKSLRGAREAFWKGDVDEAIEKYKSLIATSGDNPDFYGELGNVYYANGKWSDAANMYYEAGTRLAEQKQYGPAMHMVSILRGLKSDKADVLEKSVTEATWPAQQ